MKLKTINIAKHEFEISLIQLIENSNIPACILKDIFDKYLRQLETIAENDYKRDLQQLQKQQQQIQNDESSQQ